MKRFEYKFVEVAAKNRGRAKASEAFDECKGIIVSEAENGWRLKQVVTPFNEKMGVYGAVGYEIIFEREI